MEYSILVVVCVMGVDFLGDLFFRFVFLYVMCVSLFLCFSAFLPFLVSLLLCFSASSLFCFSAVFCLFCFSSLRCTTKIHPKPTLNKPQTNPEKTRATLSKPLNIPKIWNLPHTNPKPKTNTKKKEP